MTLNMKDSWTLRQEFKKMGRVAIMGTNKSINSISPFGVLGKDILWILYQISGFINTSEIAEFLGVRTKPVSNSLTKIMKSPLAEQFITKVRSGNQFVYKSSIPKNTDIEEIYQLIVKTRSKRVNPMIKIIEQLDKAGKVEVTFSLKE